MRENLDTLSPKAVLLGWLLAAMGVLLALLAAAVGQGLGAWIGGCRWIGLSLPVGHQVWALVNQPSLAFATGGGAAGYWLGSLLLPLLLALGLVTVFPRTKSLNSELLTLHVSWACAVISVAWLPMLDPEDGHLTRWLHFSELPTEMLWMAPIVGSSVALLAAIRLLSLARIERPQASRLTRTTLVMLHLALPIAAFVGAVCLYRRDLMIVPSTAAALPIVFSAALALFRYAPAPTHTIREIGAADFLRNGIVLLILVALFWISGRPLADGRVAGLLWARETATNNIREWIDASPLLDSPPSRKRLPEKIGDR